MEPPRRPWGACVTHLFGTISASCLLWSTSSTNRRSSNCTACYLHMALIKCLLPFIFAFVNYWRFERKVSVSVRFVPESARWLLSRRTEEAKQLIVQTHCSWLTSHISVLHYPRAWAVILCCWKVFYHYFYLSTCLKKCFLPKTIFVTDCCEWCWEQRRHSSYFKINCID